MSESRVLRLVKAVCLFQRDPTRRSTRPAPRLTVVGLTAAVLLLAATTILAHEVTYEGTVAAIKPNPYAASSGIIATLEVKVSDLKRPMMFDITPKTRLLRGGRAVSFAEARIKKDEPVAVTVNHDEPDEGALEIRLAVQKQ